MTIETIERDRNRLDEFASSTSTSLTAAPSVQPMASPADRVFGAQQVAVYRDETRVLQKLAALGAAAGDDWFYRFPVKNNGQKTFIEGPSIKLANDLARIYGNCEVDTRVVDVGGSWIIYARFTDYETGYALTRPFQQNKNASRLGGADEDRRRDIALQIGVSKAIRNVVSNALQTYADYAFNAARNSLVEKIGKDLPKWRNDIRAAISRVPFDIKRAELVMGKTVEEWLAPDIAKVIAMLKAIADGMASVDDSFPRAGEADHDEETGEVKTADDLNKFTDKNTGGGTGQPGASEAERTDAHSESSATSSSQSGASANADTAAKGQAASESANPSRSKEAGAATATDNKAAVPTTEAQYIAYANAWINALVDDAAGLTRWKSKEEKDLRNKCNVPGEVRDTLKIALDKKIAEISDADRS
ncbi:MAG: hypothetical protein V4458_06010 [Pseudomonadota bacterium]